MWAICDGNSTYTRTAALAFEAMGVAMGSAAKDEGSAEVGLAGERLDVGSWGRLGENVYDVVRSAAVKDVKESHAARRRNLRAMVERAETGILGTMIWQSSSRRRTTTSKECRRPR